MMSAFLVSAAKPRIWTGRYARVPGETTALHVRLVEGQWWPVVDWFLDGMTGECPMVESAAAEALASAVNSGKALLGGGAGGAFLLNEYGQILVPASSPNDARVAIVGECTGPLEFVNVFEDDDVVIDLADDEDLRAGDVWERPYVGMPHNLSRKSEVYFWNEDESGGEKLLPDGQDETLISALRKLRGYVAVRFLAMYGGFVLTKVPVGSWPTERWEPRYVGRIDFRYWYSKEG